MTWDFVEQNTFSLAFPSQNLIFIRIYRSKLSCNAFGKPQNWHAQHCLRVGHFWEDGTCFLFSKTKLHELYIDGKKKCQDFETWARKWEKVAYFVYTSDINLLFFGEIDPPTRLAISLHTAVKNDVRCAEKAVFWIGRYICITLIAL